MSEEISFSPIGKEQIHKLESALLIGTILRPDVLKQLKNPEERLTWVDSLAVAAAAIARERAKMTVNQIAEDIGRTEATIRNHLTGKTKAGQLVKETFEKFLRGGVSIEVPSAEELERLRKELEEEKKKVENLNNVLQETKKSLQELLGKLEAIQSP